MKRDMDLIRKLLLQLEGEQVDLNEYESSQIEFHKALIWEKGLAEGPKPIYSYQRGTKTVGRAILEKLTWEGYDFLDGIREESRWMKVKDHLKGAGKIVTLESVKQAIKVLFEQVG